MCWEAPPLVGAPLARVTSWSLPPPPSLQRLCQLELQVELQVAPPLLREGRRGQAGPGLPSGAGGRGRRLWQSEASPSHLSLLQGSLDQGLAAVVLLAWCAASRWKSLSSQCSYSPVWAAVHSCAQTRPHPLWPSACDSPIPLGRCCPVGKSPAPPGCRSLL